MASDEEYGEVTQMDFSEKKESVKASQKGSRALAILRVIDDDGNATDSVLDKPQFYVGRSADCDLVIEKVNTSRFHSFISFDNINSQEDEPIYLLEDNSSKNGTFLNGKLITKPKRLRHGDRIVVGDTVLGFLVRREWELEADKKISEVQTKRGHTSSVGRIICDLQASLNVLIPDETFTPKKINVTVCDLDQGGLRLTTSEITKDYWLLLIRKKAYLQTEIEMDSLQLQIRGRMAWSHFDTKCVPAACIMGIEFQELSQDQKLKIEKGIEELSGKASPED